MYNVYVMHKSDIHIDTVLLKQQLKIQTELAIHNVARRALKVKIWSGPLFLDQGTRGYLP